MSWPKRVIEWAFCALFFIVPLIFLPVTSELFEFNKIIVTYLLTTLIVVTWIVRMFMERRIIFRRTILDIPLLLFLVTSLLSLVFSIDIHNSIFGYYSRWNGGFLSLISYSLLYWSFVSNLDSKSTLNAIRYTLITATLVALWGIAEHFGVDAHLWVQDVRNRVFSTLGQPNWLAAYLVALIWIPLSALNSKSEARNTKQILNIIVFSALFVTLLFTKSRSGLLAFGISVTIFSLLSLKSIRNLLPIGLLLLLLTVTISNPLRDLVIKSSAPAPTGPALEVGGTESGEIRKIVWTGAIRIWTSSIKNLVIGTGPETFAMAYYQHRPIEHNQTSEWELLYNKAHNEFLNQLATTGILGFASYILLLIAMGRVLIAQKNYALFAGWLSLSITNFWGFSVVIVQLLLFLIPAIAIGLGTQESKQQTSNNSMWAFVVWFTIVSLSWIPIVRFWIADTHLAAGQKSIKLFQATQDASYLLDAHERMIEAYKLNQGEPVIASELSNSAAYLSLAFLQQSTESAQQLAQLSLGASDQALSTSPHHPNYYKSRARSFILLSDLDPAFMTLAAHTLEDAIKISPTDPRLPFNLGVVYKYLGDSAKAKEYFEKSLQLKPDFADPKKQLEMLDDLTLSPSP